MSREQFSRNLGILSEDDMDKLQHTTISIAGCGCIGGFAAELLSRIGVGTLRLADPDTFDLSNINRQCAATHLTIGQFKTMALKNHLLTINPDLNIKLYSEGVNPDNLEDFVIGADYIIDGIDYFAFSDSVLLHRAARKHNKYILTAAALGFGTTVLAFSPTGMSLEQYIGLPEHIPIEQLQDITFPPSGYASQLPSYITEENVAKWLQMRRIPTISVGQALGPGVLVSKLILHILGRKEPDYIPDSYQLQFENLV